MKSKVGVIGAGPGGLSAAVLLQKKGFQVDLFEAAPHVGGRNGALLLGDYRFDIGPTFFLMPQVLEEIFHLCGRSLHEVLDLRRVDPLYTLFFADGSQLKVQSDMEAMSSEIAKFSTRDASRFRGFRERQRAKFEAVLPALKSSIGGWSDLIKIENLAALRYLNPFSVYDELASFFEDERVRLAFTFQAKYLGMSPFDCPSLFTILPHIEHELGVWHPMGGCNRVSEVLLDLFKDLGGVAHFNSRVSRCHVESGAVKGFDVESASQSSRHDFDFSVMNADFAHGIQDLFPNEHREKYRNDKVEKLKLSCSTFMLYLGIEGAIDLPHHSIFFSQNYRKNIRELTQTLELSDDPSFYVQNASVTDPTLAPAGHSALYVLVPVPNLKSGLDWTTLKSSYRNKIVQKIAERTGLDLESKIRSEKCISPLDWQADYRVHQGATFSLAHSWDQMMHFRPHNEFEDFKNFYLVGGGTHPGSGLPTILQSGLLAADLIEKKYNSLAHRMPKALRQVGLSVLDQLPLIGSQVASVPAEVL